MLRCTSICRPVRGLPALVHSVMQLGLQAYSTLHVHRSINLFISAPPLLRCCPSPATAPVLQAQADMLRRLNRSGRHEQVVQAFESGAVHNTGETFGEYVKALVKLDSLDSGRLFSTLQRGAEASFAARGLAAAPPAAYPPPAAAAAPWFAGEALQGGKAACSAAVVGLAAGCASSWL